MRRDERDEHPSLVDDLHCDLWDRRQSTTASVPACEGGDGDGGGGGGCGVAGALVCQLVLLILVR